MRAFLVRHANILLSLVGALLLLWGVLFALRQLNLLPPERLTMAAGPAGSAYHETATAYQKVLARDGIALAIIESGGSLDNRAMLEGTAPGADIALVQGGIPMGPDVEGLASVHVEPLWIFARAGAEVAADPNLWQGLRVAAGATGSGVRFVADQLVDITGAGSLAGDVALESGGQRAVEQLLAGEIDIALFVAPADAPYLQPLFSSDQVQFLSLAHSAAVALKLQGARQVQMPSGILDYRRPFPAESLELIALVTRLVAREGLHPALVNRLVHAVQEVHAGGDLIPADQHYPSARDMAMPGNVYATRLFEDGFSPLEKVLPYWIVAQFNRILLLLLPALFLLLPLMRVLPALYQWIFRGRVYRHYTRVHEIDQALAGRADELSSGELAALRRELDQIERSLRRANLPNIYRKQAYTLVHHIDYVRSRIPEGQGET